MIEMYYNEFHANRIKEKATDYIYVGTYEKGDKILNDGDTCNCLFYIEKGFIRQHYLKQGHRDRYIGSLFRVKGPVPMIHVSTITF